MAYEDVRQTPEPIPDVLVVHGGMFHADDVMTAVLLRHLNPDLRIERALGDVEARKVEPGTLVADVGGGRFDHHQIGAAVRDDGHRHAAVGLVYEAFPQLRPKNEQVAKWFEDRIEDIEDWDNGVNPTHGHNDISQLVSCMNPNWDEEPNVDERFEDAVEFLGTHVVDYAEEVREDASSDLVAMGLGQLDAFLSHMRDVKVIERDRSVARAWGVAQAALEASDGHVVSFDRFGPWPDVLCESSAVFVTYPSLRGGYNVQCVPEMAGSTIRKQSLPRAWLEEAPEGCFFVHQDRFIAAFDTEEHAVAAAREAFAQASRRRVPDAYESSDEIGLAFD